MSSVHPLHFTTTGLSTGLLCQQPKIRHSIRTRDCHVISGTVKPTAITGDPNIENPINTRRHHPSSSPPPPRTNKQEQRECFHEQAGRPVDPRHAFRHEQQSSTTHIRNQHSNNYHQQHTAGSVRGTCSPNQPTTFTTSSSQTTTTNLGLPSAVLSTLQNRHRIPNQQQHTRSRISSQQLSSLVINNNGGTTASGTVGTCKRLPVTCPMQRC